MSHHCENCGAPLAANAPTCTYCEAPNAEAARIAEKERAALARQFAKAQARAAQESREAENTARREAARAQHRENAKRQVARASGGAAVWALIPVVIVAVSGWLSFRGRTMSVAVHPTSSVPELFPAFSTKTKVSDLHTASLVWNKTTPIDAPPVVGSLERFDVLANLDWAGSIGRAWWPDAELKSVKVDPVSTNGLADLREGEATFDLYSAACVADHKKRAETTKNLPDNTCHLNLTVGKGGVTVTLALIGRDGLKTLAQPSCSLAQVFSRVGQGGGLEVRPSYAAKLAQESRSAAPEWQVSAGKGSVAMKSGAGISAEFCKGAAPGARPRGK